MYLRTPFPPCVTVKFENFLICSDGQISPSLTPVGIYGNLQKKFWFGTAENVLTLSVKWVSLVRNGAFWSRMETECY
jgi:hypothetical protein